MSKMSMSEIIAAYNELAVAQGKEEVTSFKNLSAARAALTAISQTQGTQMNDQVETT